MGEHDEHGSGKTRTWYSVQIHRRYKTDDGKYHETNSYALADLVQVAHIARLAEEWVNRHAEAPTSPAANDGGNNTRARYGDFLLHAGTGYCGRRAC